jgi:hypothetical protein
LVLVGPVMDEQDVSWVTGIGLMVAFMLPIYEAPLSAHLGAI